jgi:hypothetical protein
LNVNVHVSYTGEFFELDFLGAEHGHRRRGHGWWLRNL